jgi:hypothetical protein
VANIDKSNISLVVAILAAGTVGGAALKAGSYINDLETAKTEIKVLKEESKANSEFKQSIKEDLTTIKNQLDFLTKVAAGDLIIPAKGHK